MNTPILLIKNNNEQAISDSILDLADDLILNKALSVNDSLYSFIDIEVYYWHENHRDEYAKGIEHKRPFGELEMHQYGIDLSLGNNEQEGMGGILIRGLYDLNTGERYQKSEVKQVVFNSLHIGENTIMIINRKMLWKKTFQSKRLNLGEHSNDQGKTKYKDALYRFLAFYPELFRNFKGKEQVIRESNLGEPDKTSLLDYTLRK
mgnify:CR=1 FL=1